jgi:hypothetical protein
MANPQIEVEIGAKIKSLFDSLNDAEGALQKFAGKAQKIGTALSLAITTPLLLIGTASLKAASDGEETASKFETVFKSIQAQAEISFKSLRNEFGLSSTASKQLLGDTGDLLTGFGFSQTAALDLATQVAKLGVDLASFTNFSGGAEGATQALTKALLGERESVKALGIAILEEDVNKQVAINTSKGLTFETERQAKAYATLDIALSQSKNAIGDFSRTSDQFANQQRIARARIEELAESLGKVLLPLATRIAGIIIKAADSFNQLSDGTKEIVVIIGALAASIGPLLLGVGTAIKIFPLLTAGFVALKGAVIAATGPFGLIAIAVAAAIPLLINLNNELNRTSKISGEVKASLLAQKIDETNKFLDDQVVKYRQLLPQLTEEERINKILVFELAQIRKQRGKSTEAIKAEENALIKWGLSALQSAKAVTVLGSSTKQTLEEFSKLQDIANEKIFRQFAEEANAFNKELDETIRLAKAIESINFSGFQTTAKFDDDGQIIEGTRKKIKLLETPIIEFDIKIGDPPIPEIADELPSGGDAFNFKFKEAFDKLKEEFSAFSGDFIGTVVEFTRNIKNIIQQNLGEAFVGIGESLGTALATGTSVVKALGQSLLSSIANFLGDLGQQLIAFGVAGIAFGSLIEAIKKGGPLSIPAGIAAIGAGVALVAASAAIRSTASKGLSGGGAGVGTSGVGAGSSFTGTGGTGFSAERNINLVGSFRIAGSDLLYVIDQSNQARI